MEIFKSVVKGDGFWEQLLADSKQFQEATLYSNVLHVNNGVDSVFKHFFQRYNIDKELGELAKIRVHVQGERNEDSLLLLKSNPPKSEETLNDWGIKLFEGKPWCIVLDKVSGCIDDITVPIAEWVQPLLSLYPIGSLAVDISPYIGKYGYTPFGAHIDVPGISVLHLHLGPNKKEMTVWSAEEFRELNRSEDKICHDFEPFLSKGKTYSIEAGDIFHLPAGTHYHIGKADEFSIGLTIGLKRENAKSILQKALKEHQKSNDGLSSAEIVETYNLKKKSNGGFMKSPLLKKSSVSDLIGKKLRISNPFKLILKEIDEFNLGLYVRGRFIAIPNNEELKKSVELLNQGGIIALTDDFFNRSKMNPNRLTEFMVKLYNYGGIVLQ